MKLAIEKIRESITSILPIVVIVLIVEATPVFDLTGFERMVFAICSFVLIIGMALFNIGAELSMTTMGDLAGSALIKTKKMSLILIVAFAMGLLITVAEPDLKVLADLISAAVNPRQFIYAVGIGVGVFLVIALLKVIFNKPFATLILLFYMILFALNTLLEEIGKNSFVPLAFDSGGVTTGPITVPFIMAFGVGIASTLGGKNSNENSFGFVSFCSVGPMLVVMLFLILAKGDLTYVVDDYSIEHILSEGVFNIMAGEALNVIKAVAMILGFFLIMNATIIKLPINKLIQIIAGLVITFIGLVLFLTSASIGFLPVGFKMGSQLIKANGTVAVVLCFIVGMAVVLAEPAVQVLNRQVEDITGGAVTKRSMLIALAIGVGVSIALSCVRILFDFSLLYYLIPGYVISLALTLFVPPLYTAIAFDSGGVASGPLTSTFILPFMIGACSSYAGEDMILRLAFGVVSMVAMAPLITIQLLGFKSILTRAVRDNLSMNKILKADDNQIVYIEGV